MDINFGKSNQKQSISRSAFTILDLFGLIGGIVEVLLISGGLFVAIFADRLLNYTILTNLYHVDTTTSQKDYNNKFMNSKDRVEPFFNSDSCRSQEHKSDEIDANFEAQNNSSNLIKRLTQTERNQYKNSLISKAKTNIMNRRLYNYETSDMCYNLLC